jgi:hypothetical protein
MFAMDLPPDVIQEGFMAEPVPVIVFGTKSAGFVSDAPPE